MSKRTIFDIQADLLEVLDAVDEEGEYIYGAEAIEALRIERHEKRRGIAMYIKNERAFLDAAKEARDRINKKIKATENHIDYWKRVLEIDLDGEKMKEPEFSVYYHTTKNVVDIAEGAEDRLPDEFVRVKREPDRTALKEALQDGEIIDGVKLVDKISLVVR